MPSADETPFVRITSGQRLAVLAAFIAYLVLVAVARSQDPTPTPDWIPLLLLVYVGLMAAPFLVVRGALGWFHPLVLSSLLRFVDLLRRFSMYSWGLDWHRALPMSPTELSEVIELHLALHIVAVVAYYAGLFLGPRIRPWRLWVRPPDALVPKLLVIALLAVASFVVFVGMQGGLSAHIESWSFGRHDQLAGMFYVLTATSFGLPACWIWIAYRRNATRSPLFWATALSSLALTFAATGSRSSAVYAALIGLLIWMLRERRVAFFRLIAIGVVALYVIAALGNFRRSGWYGESAWDAASETSLVDSVVSGAGGELSARATTGDGTLAILARVPDDVPLLYGRSYLAIVTLPVPRSLWPEKPKLIDGQVGQIFFGLNAGVPAGGIGEAFWNFHVVGVIVVFFLFGLLHRWLVAVFVRNRDQPAMIVLYATTMLMLRDPSSLGITIWLISIAQVVIVLAFVGALGRSGAPQAA